MKYSTIIYTDMINGEGIRVSIFVSGCTHHCEGCFNQETWDPNNGQEFNQTVEEEIINYFTKYQNSLKGISILGGDPTYPENIEPLKAFITKFKNLFPHKDIWIWSGFKFEMIKKSPSMLSLISMCDILIDGRFIKAKKDLNLKWRGSTNQRVIDIQKSLEQDQIILHCSDNL